jgi:imidazolonepropionase-like amidohydrolase
VRLVLACVLVGSVAHASPTIVKAPHLHDGVSDQRRDGVAVAVDGDRIVAVAPAADLAKKYPRAPVIDLGGATLVPGLIDAHTHVSLDDDMGPGVYDEILLKHSTSYRAIAAGANAGTALRHGFTSLRDLDPYCRPDAKTWRYRGGAESGAQKDGPPRTPRRGSRPE